MSSAALPILNNHNSGEVKDEKNTVVDSGIDDVGGGKFGMG
jgi:hypothetical protein